MEGRDEVTMNKKLLISLVVIVSILVVFIMLHFITANSPDYDKYLEEDKLPVSSVGDSSSIVQYGESSGGDEDKVIDYLDSIGFSGNLTKISTDGVQVASGLVMEYCDVIDYYWSAWNEEVSYELIVIDGEVIMDTVE